MEEKIHKRRVHYSGTHPKRFEEKYKEHNPEKYADTIEKVISKGSTPAGMHISICVNEILDFLQIQPGQQGLDGHVGHQQAQEHGQKGRRPRLSGGPPQQHGGRQNEPQQTNVAQPGVSAD